MPTRRPAYAAAVASDCSPTAGSPGIGDHSRLGAHGQTVRHRPELGYTIQLLNRRPARRGLTGIDGVCDLRSADVAAGGQGAPLVPAFHAQMFRHPIERRVVVNLGGIANVSLLPPAATAQAVLGFDTGPANTLLDHWCRRHTGAAFDRDGDWARSGRRDAALLAIWLAEPYFELAPPKSTGRDLFNRRLAGAASLAARHPRRQAALPPARRPPARWSN